MTRFLGRFGFGDDSFLLILSVIIGIVTGMAAVAFHELINLIRDLLYSSPSAHFLYETPAGLTLLVLFPALGGLLVGLISRYVFRTREGHGIVDVVESVVRTSGFQKPATAIEKIFTSAMTIGTGGSAGAEGPIVQIGAGIASGVGQLFRVARQHMPILTGCGCAAGISAIFNAPFGGVLFTLEVILQDFSIRSFTPVVLASVIAQVTTQGIFQFVHHTTEYRAIFDMPALEITRHSVLNWEQVGNFIVLGLACGLIGLCITRLMYYGEHFFNRLSKIPKVIRPALGGAMLGGLGIVYIYLFGHLMLHSTHNKPFAFEAYPMPAFYGDGYGAIQQMLVADFYTSMGTQKLLLLLAFLCAAKVLGTVFTLSSGGSGGIIAPSVFIGATAGAIIGYLYQRSGWFPSIQPELYALVGMGAVLAAVVHAPLASILICFELTRDYKVMLPAMLACIIATGIARVIYRDSIYTLSLRLRGIRIGGVADLTLLRRLSLEQVTLDPATIVNPGDPLERVFDLMATTGATDFVVADENGNYEGMLVSDDMKTALLEREAVPLLLVGELLRTDVPVLKTSDDLSTVLDRFSKFDVGYLPVALPASPSHVVGLVSRAGLMRRYQRGLAEPS